MMQANDPLLDFGGGSGSTNVPGLGLPTNNAGTGGDNMPIQPFDLGTKQLNPTPQVIGGGDIDRSALPIPGVTTTNTVDTSSPLPVTTAITATPAASVFPANTGGTAGIPGATNNVTDLNVGSLLGFNSGDPSQLVSQLDTMFGKGVGQLFYNFLSSGAGYNPQVASALQAANLPYEERTRNNILESFGASGGRYGSPAAIGLGDFESSYGLGQQKILADLYNTSVDRYARMFGGILDTAHLEQANKLQWPDILNNIMKLLGSGGGGSGAGGNIGNIIKAIQGLFSKTPPSSPIGAGPSPSLPAPGPQFPVPKSNGGPQGSSTSNIIFDSNNYDPGSFTNPDGSINWDNWLNADPSQGGLGGFWDNPSALEGGWTEQGAGGSTLDTSSTEAYINSLLGGGGGGSADNNGNQYIDGGNWDNWDNWDTFSSDSTGDGGE